MISYDTVIFQLIREHQRSRSEFEAPFAELGKIGSDYIRADARFDHDLDALPFWGSLDTVEVVLALEQHLNVDF